MNRYDLLIQLDIVTASEVIYGLSGMFKDSSDLLNHMKGEITEKELQRINAAALKEGRQPLSFSFKQ